MPRSDPHVSTKRATRSASPRRIGRWLSLALILTAFAACAPVSPGAPTARSPLPANRPTGPVVRRRTRPTRIVDPRRGESPRGSGRQHSPTARREPSGHGRPLRQRLLPHYAGLLGHLRDGCLARQRRPDPPERGLLARHQRRVADDLGRVPSGRSPLRRPCTGTASTQCSTCIRAHRATFGPRRCNRWRTPTTRSRSGRRSQPPLPRIRPWYSICSTSQLLRRHVGQVRLLALLARRVHAQHGLRHDRWHFAPDAFRWRAAGCRPHRRGPNRVGRKTG